MTMGSDVVYHREELGTLCPCRTPEGFRDSAWHRALNAQIDDINTNLSAVAQEPGNINDPGHLLVTWLIAAALPGNIFLHPVEAWAEYTDDYPTGFDITLTIPSLPILPGQDALALLRRVDDGPLSLVSIIINPGDVQDTVPLTDSLNTAFTLLETCNEDGILPVVTERVVKASIQPATIGQRGRAAERVNALLGDVQRDDHFGIFPVNWNGVTLDFAAFTDSGDDYIVYDGRRFMVVAADKIPDVDGDPNHHWEVGLRYIKSGRPTT